jgi:hypothetical protein
MMTRKTDDGSGDEVRRYGFKIRLQECGLLRRTHVVGRTKQDDGRRPMLAQGQHRREVRVGSDEYSIFRGSGPHDVWVRSAQEADVGDMDCVMARAAQESGNFRREVGVE